jgi:hypothetical protein
VVHEGETAAGFDAVAEPLLLAAGLDVVAVGVPDRDADGAAFGGAFGEEFVQPRVRLVKEDGRITTPTSTAHSSRSNASAAAPTPST